MENVDAEAIARIESALPGPLHTVQLCRWLAGHRWTLSIGESDPAIVPIIGFVSETDDFAVDEPQRSHWNPEALARCDAELARYVEQCDGMRAELAALLARLRNPKATP